MIDRLEILNYRSVLGRGHHGGGEPAELRVEEDITTLIGKNEAGKSNLLQAANRFRNRRPLPQSDLSKYTEYSDSLDTVEILRCRLAPGALNNNAEQVKPVPWLLGPYSFEDLTGFPVRVSFETVRPVASVESMPSERDGGDIHDVEEEGVALPLGRALATGHVEIVHYGSGDHAVDIVEATGTESSFDFQSLRHQAGLPMDINEFLTSRFDEYLRLCWWFVQNIVEVAEINPEIEEFDRLKPGAAENRQDLYEQLTEQLDTISNVFNDAKPIEGPPADMEDEIAFDPPDILAIQQSADDLYRTLSNLNNPADPLEDLPKIVDQSKIDLADSEYNLRENKDSPILQGLLGLGDINLEDYSSFNSPSLEDSLNNAVEELSRYLNGFWDFEIESRQPGDTITPEDTDRYEFKHELDGETLSLELIEGDGPPIPLGQRSDGMRWIITFLLTILAQPYAQSEGRQTLVTLDDPGIHLHPEAEKRLFRAFFYVTNQAKILYTTHSPALIDRKEVDRLRIIRHNRKPSVTGVIGTTIANDLDDAKTDGEQVDPLATAREAVGWTLSDSLFRGEQTVLVEGPSDKRYLYMFNSYLNWSGRPSLDEDPTFVDSKGSQLPFLSRILAAENVSHVALMDDDTREKDFEPELEERTVRYNDILVPNTQDYEAEIEDLFDRELFIKAAAEVHEELDAETILQTPYDDAPCGIVDYIENFLQKAQHGPDELQKNEVSREIKDRLKEELRKSPEDHSETIDRFEAVISDMKRTLEEIDAE